MLCIAHECEPYGHLSVNSKPMLPAQLGRLVGLNIKDCCRYLKELEDAGVYSVTPQGAIYSRRMVADEETRNNRAAGGAAGAEHGAKGGYHGAKGGRPRGVIKPPLEPPPSSSLSSSSEKATSSADPPVAENATPAASMSIELRRKGLAVTSMHPTLLQWVADGFSIPSVLEALEIARQHKPEPEPIPPNYLDRILRNPPKKAEPAWWSSDHRILAKGRELGLEARPGEEMTGFKERIQAEIGRRKVAA